MREHDSPTGRSQLVRRTIRRRRGLGSSKPKVLRDAASIHETVRNRRAGSTITLGDFAANEQLVGRPVLDAASFSERARGRRRVRGFAADGVDTTKDVYTGEARSRSPFGVEEEPVDSAAVRRLRFDANAAGHATSVVELPGGPRRVVPDGGGTLRRRKELRFGRDEGPGAPGWITRDRLAFVDLDTASKELLREVLVRRHVERRGGRRRSGRAGD